MRLEGVGITDIGNVRAENQDSFTILSAPCSESGNRFLAVVADGVGGGKAGNVASSMAVDVLKEICLEREGDPQDIMQSAIAVANARIRETSAADIACRGMATTCTALMVAGDSAVIGHAGDSRAYLIRDRQIVRLTDDHTLPWRLYADGIIGREEIDGHPQSNVLVNAVGSRENADVDIVTAALSAGDTYLLCSDGMYKYMTDGEILEVVDRLTPEASVEHLVSTAKERGGDDNITVVIIRVSGDAIGDKTTEITTTYIPEEKPEAKRCLWKPALAIILWIYLLSYLVSHF